MIFLNAHELYKKGLAHYKEGEYEEAIKIFDEVSVMVLYFFEAYYQKANVLFQLGEYKQVI